LARRGGRTRTVYRRARSYGRRMRYSRHKWSLIKILKVAIATAPVASFAVGSYQAAGGGTKGFSAALGTISQAYTGYNPVTGAFNAGDLAIGYIPLGGAYLFGKIASRVLRL
jgi:hypothetical protein